MSITNNELYFEVDEDDEEFKKIDSEVSVFCIRLDRKFGHNDGFLLL